MANVVFQCYHFSKQFLSNLSKIKYLALFINFCFVVSLAKMVTLTNNIVYKKSAQYRKYLCSLVSIDDLFTQFAEATGFYALSYKRAPDLARFRSYSRFGPLCFVSFFKFCLHPGTQQSTKSSADFRHPELMYTIAAILVVVYKPQPLNRDRRLSVPS